MSTFDDMDDLDIEAELLKEIGEVTDEINASLTGSDMTEVPELEEDLEVSEVIEIDEEHSYQMFPFEDLYGWKPAFVPNFLVKVFKGYEAPARPDPYIPPKEEFETFVWASENGGRTNLVGPTGAGKTLMTEFYAATTGREFCRIEHNIELDKASVFGQVHITNGDTDFVRGILPRALVNPSVVCLDELSKAGCAANIIYQRLFDRNEMYLYEMKEAGAAAVPVSEHCVLCATDNTKGDGEDMDLYPASNVQDSSFMNRFTHLIEVPYASKAEEVALIQHLLTRTMPNKEINALAQFSFLLHTGFEDRTISTAFSPRQIITIIKDYNNGANLDRAVKFVYVNFCPKSELADVKETFRNSFGRELVA